MLAAEYLRSKHYRILEQNYRIRGGELDIIAENRSYVVFVEVKTRKDTAHGEAREFVDASKQRKLLYAAQAWLAAKECEKQPRFDVIEIYAPEGTATKKPVINHLQDAFRAD